MSSFRSFKWDPFLIISQIVALQTLFYLTLGFWFVIISYSVGQGVSLDLLFSYNVSRTFFFVETFLFLLLRISLCRIGPFGCFPVSFFSMRSAGKKKILEKKISSKTTNFRFFSGFAVVSLVGRYKQCLDFSLTIHFYHFLACWIYNHQIPNVFSWYLTQLISIIIMTIFSEHFSKKVELRTIPVGPRADL